MIEIMMNLQGGAKAPLYEKIYEYIKSEITDGRIPRGERLPSTRLLAKNLAVSRSTVEMAYDQLLAEGYIQAESCRGFFVCDIAELYRLRGNSVGDTGQVHRPEKPVCLVDFSPYAIDTRSFPYNVWRKISRNVLLDDSEELLMAGDGQGEYSLRSEIADYLHHARGVNCRPEQIIVGAGNDYLLLLLEKILGRHVGIAMENPTYKRAYRIFESFAYRIHTVDMDDKGMRADRLSGLPVRVAYVMPSHQYPTGAVMTIGRRAELLRWAEREPDRYLIEDDYDSEFRYRGKPIPSLQSSDEKGKVIYIGTFSKAIAPAIRVSYMVLPGDLLDIYRRDCSFYSCTVSRIDQRILNEFIRDGYFERHLNKMRMRYRAKHDLLLAGLEPFKKQFVISGEDAGLHLLLTAKGNVTEQELLERAAAEKVKAYGMSENMVEATMRKATVLLGFGSIDEAEMQEGLRRLQKAWL